MLQINQIKPPIFITNNNITMNIKAKVHPLSSFDKEASMSGVGANALWDGPLDTTAYPKGKGYSGGSKGIELRFDNPNYQGPSPITQRVKSKI